MDKLEYIEEYSKNGYSNDNTLLYALVRCLSYEKQIRLFNRIYSYDNRLRKVLLKLLVDNYENDESEISSLIAGILIEYSQFKGNTRDRVDYCLRELFIIANKSTQIIIIDFLSHSKYTNARKTALSLLKYHKIIGYEDFIEEEAYSNKSKIALNIIIDRYSSSYIFEHRNLLIKLSKDKFVLARLYKRACEFDKNCIEELRAINEISYCYLKIKLGLKISEDEMSKIIIENKNQENYNLLIWVLGQLKYWNLIISLADEELS
ncbi:MAG: hypothetical protein K9M99_10385 [Candidatus Cloacimonetes bacterium]|nr:hypothetical protein [Candidatus Cloacimonadota bacterium]